jgi:hypothetical protein
MPLLVLEKMGPYPTLRQYFRQGTETFRYFDSSLSVTASSLFTHYEHNSLNVLRPVVNP